MSETKDKSINAKKIRETRFIIFIPLLITAICAWFDLLFIKEKLNVIYMLKTIYTYFFPSIASSMITLIIQKAVYDDDSCSIADNRVLLSSLLLIFYGVTFLSCLIEWNLLTTIVFGIVSIIYMIVTWLLCLDKKITHNIIDPVTEEREALKKAIAQNKEDMTNVKCF